jgi:hypothetical protein
LVAVVVRHVPPCQIRTERVCPHGAILAAVGVNHRVADGAEVILGVA